MNQWEHRAVHRRAGRTRQELVMVLHVIGCVRDVYKFSLANHKAKKRKANQ